jgi:DNA-binding MarR family transcriptional regulator
VELDQLVHQPARLSILTSLYVVEDANATYVLQQTGLTWGNLGSHLAKLEDAGYVKVEKGFKGKQPQTTISLTPRGRAALTRYREQMLTALDPIEESPS